MIHKIKIGQVGNDKYRYPGIGLPKTLLDSVKDGYGLDVGDTIYCVELGENKFKLLTEEQLMDHLKKV